MEWKVLLREKDIWVNLENRLNDRVVVDIVLHQCRYHMVNLAVQVSQLEIE